MSKNTAGYPLAPGMDWVDLLVGSEGTLAVVTRARVRLLPAPAAAALSGVIFFAGDGAALDAVDAWRGLGLTMLEYMDRPSLSAPRARSRRFRTAPARRS